MQPWGFPMLSMTSEVLLPLALTVDIQRLAFPSSTFVDIAVSAIVVTAVVAIAVDNIVVVTVAAVAAETAERFVNFDEVLDSL